MESPFIHQIRAKAVFWENRYNQTQNEDCKVIAVSLRSIADNLTSDVSRGLVEIAANMIGEISENEESSQVLEKINLLSNIILKKQQKKEGEEVLVFHMQNVSHAPAAQVVYCGSGGGGGGGWPPKDWLKSLKEEEEKRDEINKIIDDAMKSSEIKKANFFHTRTFSLEQILEKKISYQTKKIFDLLDQPKIFDLLDQQFQQPFPMAPINLNFQQFIVPQPVGLIANDEYLESIRNLYPEENTQPLYARIWDYFASFK